MITNGDNERFIIGFAMQSGKAVSFLYDNGLSMEDFHNRDYAFLYDCILSLLGTRQNISALALQEFIKSKTIDELHFVSLGRGERKLEAVERIALLIRNISDNFHNSEKFADIFTAIKKVKEEAERKKILLLIQSTHSKIIEGEDIPASVEGLISELSNTQHKHCESDVVNLFEATKKALAQLEAEERGEILRYTTGFNNLDGLLHGIDAGTFTVVVAEQGIGKSFLISQMAMHLAKKNIPVALLSLEMQAEQIARRTAGAKKQISLPEQRERLEKLQSETKGLPFYIRTKSITLDNIGNRLQSLQRNKKIRILFLDYLQLVGLPSKGNPTTELDALSKKLKQLTQDTGISIVCIASVLTKAISQRNDRKPIPSDIRGSSQILFDCDLFFSLWKPYEDEFQNYIELKILKGREGQFGECAFEFDADTLKLKETELKAEPMQEQNKMRKAFSMQ